jgi:hypothetical protein
MNKNICRFLALLALLVPFRVVAQSQPAADNPSHAMSMPMNHAGMSMNHEHGPSVPVTYAELTETASLLERAHRATEKYQDVRVAESDGYHAFGPDVAGMGIHYVGTRNGPGFSVEHPAILLYEKSSSAAGGYALVGVSYLYTAPEGTDGQPQNPPFPKSLVNWHRHENLCVLADRSVKTKLTEEQCTAQGGSFTAETQWMVHAWIWKDSPAGVFSPMNPSVQ